MKTELRLRAELRLRPHSVLPGHRVVELWWDGQFIGEVTGADGSGVRVITKFPTQVIQLDGPDGMVTEVRIDPARETT